MKRSNALLLLLLLFTLVSCASGNHTGETRSAEEIQHEVSAVSGSESAEESKETSLEAIAAKQPAIDDEITKSGQENGMTCKISINCSSVFDNLDKLTPGKDEIIPEDGFILAETEVSLYAGESAFDVLLRVTRDNKIHMEHSKTPVYKSGYIEGINNLYEFDCGELSGWMYQVNGVYPAYGSSGYVMQDGDILNWNYTCDFGRDIGGDFRTQNQ